MKKNTFVSGLALIISFMACNIVDKRTDINLLPKTFLIPFDCEGILRIVLEEKTGTTPKEENGRQIFEFQKNGFLILNMDFLKLGKDDEYYLVDKHGNKTKVTQISNFKDRVDQMPSIVVGGVAVTDLSSNTIILHPAKTNWSTKTNTKTITTAIAFQEFYLYNKGTAEIKTDYFEPKMDSITKSVVYAYRANNQGIR
jgi:hypothetical protein